MWYWKGNHVLLIGRLVGSCHYILSDAHASHSGDVILLQHRGCTHRLSFPEDSRKPASCWHHDSPSTPPEWPCSVALGARWLRKSHTCGKDSRFGTWDVLMPPHCAALCFPAGSAGPAAAQQTISDNRLPGGSF